MLNCMDGSRLSDLLRVVRCAGNGGYVVLAQVRSSEGLYEYFATGAEINEQSRLSADSIGTNSAYINRDVDRANDSPLWRPISCFWPCRNDRKLSIS